MNRLFMHRLARVVALVLVSVLLMPEAAFAKKPLTPEQAKQKITQRGVGHSVRLVLTDDSQLKGIIAKLGNEDVEIGVEGSGEVQTVAYSQIREYHNGKLSKGAKTGWAVAGGVLGALVVWAAVAGSQSE